MVMYIGIVDGSADVWGVRIPDFPGCHGGGASPEAAVADATTALREFAADMVADGEALPEPRSLEDIVAELEAEVRHRAASMFSSRSCSTRAGRCAQTFRWTRGCLRLSTRRPSGEDSPLDGSPETTLAAMLD